MADIGVQLATKRRRRKRSAQWVSPHLMEGKRWREEWGGEEEWREPLTDTLFDDEVRSEHESPTNLFECDNIMTFSFFLPLCDFYCLTLTNLLTA